jgi:tight adherence protein C
VSAAAGVALVAGALAASALVEAAALVPRRAPGMAGRRSALALLARLGRRIGASAAPRDLDARLAAAGCPLGLRAAEAMAVKGGAAVLALGFALPLAAFAPGRSGILAALVAPAGAFLAPDVWLRRRADARGRTMDAELPELLDLMRVALNAGLSLDRALADVARRDQGLAARELRTAATQIALGVPRERALAQLATRCPSRGIATLVRTLERGARHGTPLAASLAAQAREARATHARQLSERAARATPQIQLVVALLLVPSVLLLVAASLIAALLS